MTEQSNFDVYIEKIEFDPSSVDIPGGLASKGVKGQFLTNQLDEIIGEAIFKFSNNVIRNLSRIESDMDSQYNLEEIEISTMIVFDGKISFKIIESGGSVNNGIKFLFKRKK
jgi:hypothetical protein